MSPLKMKSVNKVVHAITGITFFVGLNDFANDEITIKCMLTEDNNQICYFDFVSNTLKNHGCESYNVLVYVPDARYDLSHPAKTSHSK